MSKVYTPFQTKTTQKPTLWTRVGIYMAYTREFPPGGGRQWDHFKCKFLISTCQSTTYHPTPQKAHLAPPPPKKILLSSGFLSQSYYHLFQIDDCINLYRILKVYFILLWLRKNKIPDV